MTMFYLAILPSIVLLIYIYKMDKREKEPAQLLFQCFILGIIIIIPVLIMETVLDKVIDFLATPGSIVHSFLNGFVVAGLSEELFKYLALKNKTWESREYNCFFDGIVYSVFVSLGFASFENMMYVMDGGLSSALVRMFTAVPGHACTAVFMGYFYSKAKKASVEKNQLLENRNIRLALAIPILFHGLYDSLLFMEETVVGESVVIVATLLWFAIVAIEFFIAFRTVNVSSKFDTVFWASYGVEMPNPLFSLKKGTWICQCRNINRGNYCVSCGAKRPE